MEIILNRPAPTRHFQFKHFPKSKIISESRFLKKYYIITIKKNFWRVLICILKKSKLDFPLYFQILLSLGGFLFRFEDWPSKLLSTGPVLFSTKSSFSLFSVQSYAFLAALSSSRSLVVRRLVGHLCEKLTFRVLNGNLNHPTYLPLSQ